jgi:prophage regulatory protein
MNEGTVFVADDRFLKIKECLKIIPVAPSTWWAGIKDGRFPNPVKLGGNTFWRYSDVMKVVAGPLKSTH